MTDSAIQRYAKEAARAAQFPLGLRGRQVKFTQAIYAGNDIVRKETIGQILECVPCSNNSTDWRFLLLLESEEIISKTYDYSTTKLELLG